MFKRLSVLSFIFLISISLIYVNPILAKEKNQKTKNIKEYGDYKEYMRKEVGRREIQLMIITPKREGRDATKYGSGFAILEKEYRAEDINGKAVEYITYYILSNVHVVSDEEWDLEEYEQHNVRIYVLGKTKEVPAELIAWEWADGVALFRVDVPKDELEDFKIQVVEFANELAGSVYGSKYLDKETPTIWFGGYPTRRPVAYPGYILRYCHNYMPNKHTYFVKIAEVDPDGLYGSGQSGAAVFNKNLEVVGMVWGIIYPYGALDPIGIVIPIDVIVERFLKNLLRTLPELKSIGLPNFELEKLIKDKPVGIGRPKNVKIKQDDDNSKN